MNSHVNALKIRLAQLRMHLLSYHYDYDRTNNERIIEFIRKDMANTLDSNNDRERRFSRTIAQHRAQLAMRPRASVWLFEVASAFALPLFLAWGWITHLAQGGSRYERGCDGIRIVFSNRWKRNPEIFAVPEEFANLDIVTRELNHHRLSTSDVKSLAGFLFESIWGRSPFPIQLILKCAVDIATVRAAITGLRPGFILVYWEFSCSLSAITQIMDQEGIKTYNIMHGDKHYYAKHAFFESHRCYCWNDFYVNIFKQEYVYAEFRTFINPGFVISEAEAAYRAQHNSLSIGIAAPHLATLASRDEDIQAAAHMFAATVNSLALRHAVTIRPHPFYSEEFIPIQEKLSSQVSVETPNTKPARNFLLEHGIIIGTVSSLLLEAAHLGGKVIIIRTAVMASIENYHYLYKMENVFTSTLEDLADTIASIYNTDLLQQTGASDISLDASNG